MDEQTEQQVLLMLRKLVFFGLCAPRNTADRKSLAEKYASLAAEACRRLPSLELNHCGHLNAAEKALGE